MCFFSFYFFRRETCHFNGIILVKQIRRRVGTNGWCLQVVSSRIFAFSLAFHCFIFGVLSFFPDYFVIFNSLWWPRAPSYGPLSFLDAHVHHPADHEFFLVITSTILCIIFSNYLFPYQFRWRPRWLLTRISFCELELQPPYTNFAYSHYRPNASLTVTAFHWASFLLILRLPP